MSQLFLQINELLSNHQRERTASLGEKLDVINIMLKNYKFSLQDMRLLENNLDKPEDENNNLIYLTSALKLFLDNMV